jgi:hypothetical protein
MDNWQMHNWYHVETEAQHRRQEWERAVEAEAQAALARSEHTRPLREPIPHMPVLSVNLRRLAVRWGTFFTSIAAGKSTKKLVSTAQPHQAS